MVTTFQSPVCCGSNQLFTAYHPSSSMPCHSFTQTYDEGDSLFFYVLLISSIFPVSVIFTNHSFPSKFPINFNSLRLTWNRMFLVKIAIDGRKKYDMRPKDMYQRYYDNSLKPKSQSVCMYEGIICKQQLLFSLS